MLQAYTSEIVGESASSAEIHDFIRREAKGSAPVLLLGEAGTGKELVARSIHFGSARRNSPFLMIDCSLHYESELERELFGYRPAPGEPAEAARRGLLEFSPRGSCYAANVEELSPSIQARILNLLDTGYLEPVGGDRPTPSRVRLIFSSEKNLEGLTAGGLFLPELYRRFAGHAAHLRALRERAEDIGPLVRHFLVRFATERGGPDQELDVSAEALEALASYPWPGNVDELKAEVGRLVRAGHRRVVPEVLTRAMLNHWHGRCEDPQIVRVLDEIEAHIREFRVMGRLDAQYGDVLLDVADWDVLFKSYER